MPSEVRECAITRCALHPFRMGQRPKKASGELPAEAKAALLARLGAADTGGINKQEKRAPNEGLAP
ncbi:hypothetical protein [Sandarakinorhabdus rubra]|uniref:hypothetical protein n=1 Tax=Sandarakinorhabdus rubra TaxID=2672568 RepID=UPI0013DB8599|nr:hypothetical protein [Sandarakinorhabdus rubra]